MAALDKVRYLLRICFLVLSMPAMYTSQALQRLHDHGNPLGDIEARSILKVQDSERTDLKKGLWRTTKTNHQLFNAVKPTYFLKHWHQKSQNLRPTAWLDGVRGVAALIVTIYHYAYLWPWAQTGWGVSKNDHHFMQLHFIRVIISGGFMVRIFFMISGKLIPLRSSILIRLKSGKRITHCSRSGILKACLFQDSSL